MLPAGEMWSVVTESPNLAKTCKLVKVPCLGNSFVKPSKYGGKAM